MYAVRYLRKQLKVNKATLDPWAIKEQVLGTLLVVPLAVALLVPALQWRGIEVWGPLPGKGIILRDVLLMLLGCDTMFYWIHRLLHSHPSLYKLHKQHHKYKASNIWSSEFFSPIDMVLNILPGVLPALLLGSHYSVLMLFTFLRQWQTVQVDLPGTPPCPPSKCLRNSAIFATPC